MIFLAVYFRENSTYCTNFFFMKILDLNMDHCAAIRNEGKKSTMKKTQEFAGKSCATNGTFL